MNCPYCRRTMTPGKIEAHGTRFGTIDQTTYFTPEKGDKEDILKQTTRTAFRCGDCSTLLIKGRFASEEP